MGHLLLALSGFRCDVPHKKLTFAPIYQEDDFKCFWSTGKAWGTYTQTIKGGKKEYKVDVLYGKLDEDMQIVVS